MSKRILDKIQKSSRTQIILLCLLATIAWAVNLFFRPSPVAGDAAIYADLARNILKEQRLTSRLTQPIWFNYHLPLTPLGWSPYIPPLYSLVLAVSFFVFGVNDFVVALANGLIFLLSIPVLYLLAKKIYDWQVALLTCFWYIFTPSILLYSGWGYAEMLFIFLVILGFFLIVVKKRFFLAGVVFSLSNLTKFQGILFLLPIFVSLAKTRKLRSSFLFLIGFVLIIILKKLLIPPLAQDYSDFKTNIVWMAVAQNALFPESLFGPGRRIELVTFGEILNHQDLVWRKVLVNAYSFLKNLLNISLPAVTMLFILSFFKDDAKKEARLLKLLIFAVIIIFLLFNLVTFNEFRYFQPLLPLITIFAAETFLTFLKKINSNKLLPSVAIFSFLFIVLPSFTFHLWGTNILRGLNWPRKPQLNQIVGRIAKETTPPEAILACNFDDAVAWYGQRRAIKIPLTLADLAKLDKQFVPLDAVLLTGHKYQVPLEPEWQDLIDNPHDFGSFYLAKKIEVKAEENYYQTPIKIILYLKKPPSVTK